MFKYKREIHLDILLYYLYANEFSILKLKLLVLMRKMHDCSIICIFVCFPQPLCLLSNLASQRPVSRGNTSHTSITLDQTYAICVHHTYLLHGIFCHSK